MVAPLLNIQISIFEDYTILLYQHQQDSSGTKSRIYYNDSNLHFEINAPIPPWSSLHFLIFNTLCRLWSGDLSGPPLPTNKTDLRGADMDCKGFDFGIIKQESDIDLFNGFFLHAFQVYFLLSLFGRIDNDSNSSRIDFFCFNDGSWASIERMMSVVYLKSRIRSWKSIPHTSRDGNHTYRYCSCCNGVEQFLVVGWIRSWYCDAPTLKVNTGWCRLQLAY